MNEDQELSSGRTSDLVVATEAMARAVERLDERLAAVPGTRAEVIALEAGAQALKASVARWCEALAAADPEPEGALSLPEGGEALDTRRWVDTLARLDPVLAALGARARPGRYALGALERLASQRATPTGPMP